MVHAVVGEIEWKENVGQQ